MKKNIFTVLTLSVLALVPFVALAQPADFVDVVALILNGFLVPLIAVAFAFATLYFLWGVVTFIMHGDDVKTREEGKKKMIWGIIALFVMFSMWGLVNVLAGSFGLDNTVPVLPTGPSTGP